jgi:enamine deaminase RidA (YjgF/YER057c/UK114 family)
MKREVIRVQPLSTYLEKWMHRPRPSRVTVKKNPPARIFVCVPAWPGRFDIEIDCIAAV